jgi:hypothetical protein
MSRCARLLQRDQFGSNLARRVLRTLVHILSTVDARERLAVRRTNCTTGCHLFVARSTPSADIQLEQCPVSHGFRDVQIRRQVKCGVRSGDSVALGIRCRDEIPDRAAHSAQPRACVRHIRQHLGWHVHFVGAGTGSSRRRLGPLVAPSCRGPHWARVWSCFGSKDATTNQKL